VETTPSVGLHDGLRHYTVGVRSLDGSGPQTYNELATAEFGETVNVPVYVSRVPTSTGNTTVTISATSESDPTKSVTAVLSASGSRPTPVSRRSRPVP
jgi:hypothetical protein